MNTEKTQISAEIIADSISPSGDRLTTFILTFPRIVLAELNTHRMFSRNSASSRAIPFKKMVERCKEDPFIPIAFQKDHSGMQGTEYLESSKLLTARQKWLIGRNIAIQSATSLNEMNVTKQLCNRILEPFMWHTVIVTASEYGNFFALRAHDMAEIHIQKLAYLMLEEYNKSEPKKLEEREWHIPFGDKMDGDRILELLNSPNGEPLTESMHIEFLTKNLKVKIATARCARISYNDFEGNDDYEKDIALHDRLSRSGHWSPFEHCARLMTHDEYMKFHSGRIVDDVMESTTDKGWCGNFRGFIQYRKTFQSENIENDSRIEK